MAPLSADVSADIKPGPVKDRHDGRQCLHGQVGRASRTNAKQRAESKLGARMLDLSAVSAAAKHFQEAGAKILAKQKNPPRDPVRLNQALLSAERALLVPEGLPHRPWFRHAIYAPGEYTGYAAVVIPGVNEALDKGDAERARQQLAVLTAALDRAARVLEGYK